MGAFDFGGRSVLVVGGSSGIGNGIAQAFLAAGASVHVWGTRPGRADYSAAEGCDLAGLGYSCVDVASPEQIAQAQGPIGGLDVLVCCQGTVVYKRGEFQQEGWDRVMAINLDSLIHCATRFRAELSKARGTLIIVSSVSGFQANIGNPAYAASKAGAVSLTKTLGKAFAADGVRVNGIAPGLVETKLTNVTTGHEQRRAAALSTIPAGRLGTPADMAGAALFLASPAASFIVGQTIVVDGGMTL